MRVLLALVGKEPIPNLIPLFAAPADERFDNVQFLVSGNPRVQEVADHLADAIQRNPALSGIRVGNHWSMDAWNLDKARDDCSAAIQHHKKEGHTVVVNLSGGTKIMSLAAYQAAVSVGMEMLYVNTERGEIIRFDAQGNATASRPFTAKISIETQLRAAGREFKQNPSRPMLRPADIRPNWAKFAAFLVDRYEIAYNRLIRKVLDQVHADGGVAWGRPVSCQPLGQSVDAVKQAHEVKLWNWDQTANTITIKDQQAFEFLNGGWVEIFALVTLDNSHHFDEVLANVQVEDFAGEMDVVATLNGRLGIIECKTEGPANEDRKARLIAKHRLHEHMFGGLYAKAILALPSDNRIRDWKKLCDQYELANPIHGHELKNLANKMYRLLTPG